MKNEYKGIWKCPNNERTVRGTLSIDEEKGFVLETDGHLELSNIINGCTNSNIHITLIDCIATQISATECKYSSNIVYIGRSFESKEEIKLKRISFRLSNLDDWIWNHNFQIKKNREEKTVSVTYTMPETVLTNLNDDYVFKISTLTKMPLVYQEPQYKVEIEERSEIVIESRSKKTVEELLKQQYIFECFLKIATGINQNVHNLFVYDEDDHIIELHIAKQNIYNERKLHPLFMPFNFLQIKDRWAEIISSWYGLYEKNEDIWDLYFSVNNSTRNYVQHSFLSYVQVIESYHRSVFDKKDRKEIKDKIKDIISLCPEEHREFLQDKLAYAHEMTLKERLEQICGCCDIIDIILKTQYEMPQEEFVKLVRDNRNYYTHYDKNQKKKKSDNMTLYYITVKINMIIHYYLLKEMGFEISELYTFMKKMDTQIMMDTKSDEFDEFVESLEKREHSAN